ncbi:MAG: hypothetical protein IPL33_12425 [Sphingobacteriales bacterium]|nr:hypothetical protein [Sphingobacteriales bacterium]
MQHGVRPLVVQARERDQFKEQRAYMGAVLQHNGQTEVIAAIQPVQLWNMPCHRLLKK